MKKALIFTLAAALFVAACGRVEVVTQEVTREVTVEVEKVVTVTPIPPTATDTPDVVGTAARGTLEAWMTETRVVQPSDTETPMATETATASLMPKPYVPPATDTPIPTVTPTPTPDCGPGLVWIPPTVDPATGVLGGGFCWDPNQPQHTPAPTPRRLPPPASATPDYGPSPTRYPPLVADTLVP